MLSNCWQWQETWFLVFCKNKWIITLIGSFLIVTVFYNHISIINTPKTTSIMEIKSRVGSFENDDNSTRLKYILQWTSRIYTPFNNLEKGQKVFIHKKCPLTNCYVTDNRKYFGWGLSKFDVIAFYAPHLIHMHKATLPAERFPHQKFVFISPESGDSYPICSNRFDGYFNWTWTFRLDSEVQWGYIVIRDINNNVVGPRKHMDWIKFEAMDPITNTLKEKLKTKSKAAAWFVSNCNSKSNREKVVARLQEELAKCNLSIDVYGPCGKYKCRKNNKDCLRLIKVHYYFYLSFENSFDEDYVTEKLVTAVENYAVPIVYGGADYSRFLPEHSYLNARELSVQDLATKMAHLVKNLDEYYDYFRWKKYYTYHRTIDSVDTDEYCLCCLVLNDKKMMEEKRVYQNFRQWWDPPNRC